MRSVQFTTKLIGTKQTKIKKEKTENPKLDKLQLNLVGKAMSSIHNKIDWHQTQL